MYLNYRFIFVAFIAFALTDCKTIIGKFDFVIIGAGTAGSLLANRLSENPSVSVCLIEAGRDPPKYTQIPLTIPIAYVDPFLSWNYKMEPQPIACQGTVDAQPPYPRGKVVGGTSSINGLLYIRGNKEDFNLWAEMGATNWSYKDVLPYFKKSEGNKIAQVDSGYHGSTGEQSVQFSTYKTDLDEAILEAGRYLGVPTRDVNGETQRGFTLSPLAERNGYRCSSEKAFLRPIYGRPNFMILKNTLATKVDIDDNNIARGVFVLRDGQPGYVAATKEVIVSAGAINSPQLLQLSGVGPSELLEKYKISVKSNIPVGKNFQEHALASGLFYGVNVTAGPKLGNVLESALERQCPLTGVLTSVFLNSVGFIKSQYESRAGDYNDLEISFTHVLSLFNGLKPEYFLNYGAYALANVYTANIQQLHPKTRGTVFIKSADPKNPPAINFPFFQVEEDLNVMIAGLEFALDMINSPPLQRVGSKPIAEPLVGCEGIELYSKEYLACLAKTLTAPGYHACCTCRMGAKGDATTVVDPNLKVIGVERLRVIDASVMPVVTSGNTNVPTLMIAEKGADIIKKQYHV